MIIGIVGKMQSGKDTVGKIIQMLTDNLLEGIPTEGIADCVLNTPISDSSWRIVKYADALKDCVCTIIGCTREDLEDNSFKDTPLGKEWEIKTVSYMDGERHTVLNPTPYQAFDIKCKYPVSYEEFTSILTPRKILQLLGTEAGRQIIHPDIWINATMANYKPYTIITGTQPDVNSIHLEERLPNWVITDVRFPNELKAIKDKGGIIIKLHRSEEERFPSLYFEYLTTDYDGFYIFLYEKYPDIYKKVTHISEIALDSYIDYDAIIGNSGFLTDTVEQVKSILKKHNLCQKEN